MTKESFYLDGDDFANDDDALDDIEDDEDDDEFLGDDSLHDSDREDW